MGVRSRAFSWPSGPEIAIIGFTSRGSLLKVRVKLVRSSTSAPSSGSELTRTSCAAALGAKNTLKTSSSAAARPVKLQVAARSRPKNVGVELFGIAHIERMHVRIPAANWRPPLARSRQVGPIIWRAPDTGALESDQNL